jgi:hypothetical protein
MKANRPAALAGCLLLSALCAAAAVPDLPSLEITSNNILGFAGHKDTVWMLTDAGVNYTTDTTRTPVWHGLKTSLYQYTRAMAFGNATAVLCLDTVSLRTPGKLWYFRHAPGGGGVIDSVVLPFVFDSLGAFAKDKAVFMAREAVWSAGFFWLACEDGGLVRWDGTKTGFRAFFPGVGKQGFSPEKVRLDSANGFSVFPDSSKRVIGVTVPPTPADSAALLVLTPKTLYRFSVRDTSWAPLPSKLGDASKTFLSYLDVFGSDHAPLLFCTIETRFGSGEPDTATYRYDAARNAWVLFEKNIATFTFGKDSLLYLVFFSEPYTIRAFRGSTEDSLSIRRSFDSRISRAMNNNSPLKITDMMYLPRTDSTGALWIGTESNNVSYNGLFFSRNEESDERNDSPFVYIHREKKIETGLKETYAYPSIIANDFADPSKPNRAVFSYSLAKQSKVSISIYDWNMDVVKNVITNEDRPAGKDDKLGNGKSTDRTRDCWDGTNNAGRRVAVGVYYYKITAQSGERSFGKIIVAK